jgi:hypothetical protein
MPGFAWPQTLIGLCGCLSTGSRRTNSICLTPRPASTPMQTEHAKGAPGLAFETWDRPSKGQSSRPKITKATCFSKMTIRFQSHGSRGPERRSPCALFGRDNRCYLCLWRWTDREIYGQLMKHLGAQPILLIGHCCVRDDPADRRIGSPPRSV